MKYQDLKNEIRDLGFEEDSIFSEYPAIFRSAITRACKVIATIVKAPTGSINLDFTASNTVGHSHDLGTTTTAITAYSTTNPILINGSYVTAENGDYVVYDDGDDTTTDTDEYIYMNGKWCVRGRYDLAELSKDADGNVLFDSIDRIVSNTSAGTKTFVSYDLVDEHILVLDKDIEQDLTVYYNERILPITEDTDDAYKVQVVYPCEPLVALLAAHYVWLDDDERKAVMYWNEFDQLRQEIEARAFKPKARIVGGI